MVVSKTFLILIWDLIICNCSIFITLKGVCQTWFTTYMACCGHATEASVLLCDRTAQIYVPAEEEEQSACLSLLLPCLIPILNTLFCCCSVDHWETISLASGMAEIRPLALCCREQRRKCVPLLGVWHLMKWHFLRSLHWACLPGRGKAVPVWKPGGCNSCLAMLRSQLSSKASVSPAVLGPLTHGERLDCSSQRTWTGCNSRSKSPASSRWAEWLFLTGAAVGSWHYLQNNIC